MILSFVSSLLMAGLQAPPAPEWPRPVAQGLRDYVFISGLREADLRVESPLTGGALPAAALHRDPIAESAALRSALASLDGPLPDIFASLRLRTFGEADEPIPPAAAAAELLADVPAELRPLVSRLTEAVRRAGADVRAAVATLTPDERREVIEGLPRFAVDPSLSSFEFVQRPVPKWERLTLLLEKVDLARIRKGAAGLLRTVEESLPVVRRLAASTRFVGKLRIVSEGLVVVVAGIGDDLHNDRDAQLTIDFGGDDRYVGRHGAGIGYASVLIDVGGDDRYNVPDLSLGVGVLGIGLAWDLAGRDQVATGSLALGAGLAGVGVFRSGSAPPGSSPDAGASFHSRSLAQGFGFFGIGVFLRDCGADSMRAKYLSQGSALDGGLGACLLRGGRKLVEATGLAPTLEADSVLRARSQGYGGRFESRPGTPGGVGVFWNRGLGGSTFYGGAEAQGCGQNGSVGLVWTSEDRAIWRSDGYAQGCGTEGGVGVLFADQPSEFQVRGGAALGFGFENGIGLLAGSPGDDGYALEAGRAGMGSEGGLGLMIEPGGSDRYLIPASTHSARVSSGIGVWLDFQGTDRLASAAPMPWAGWEGDWLATLRMGAASRTSEMAEPPPGPSAEPLPNLESVKEALRQASGLAEAANLATRRSARERLAVSIPALADWLDRLGRPLRRAEAELVGDLFRSAPADLRQLVVNRIASENPWIARWAIEAVGEGRILEASPAVVAALSRPEIAQVAIRSVAALDLKQASAELMLLCAAEDALTRRLAAQGLAAVGGPEANATAQALLSSLDPWVRTSAATLLARSGPGVIETLGARIEGADEATGRAILMALGRNGEPRALEILGARLDDPRASMRIEALRQLSGRCPPGFRLKFDALRNDVDHRVRIVAASADPGR